MEHAAGLLLALFEERRQLLKEKKSIPESLSRRIQAANWNYLRLFEYGCEELD
ncbi:MAG: hypothetical protein K8U57_32930 [Planctomycetes bacterium]|nr:hypothetical protein [Planctomycetota bacterium]